MASAPKSRIIPLEEGVELIVYYDRRRGVLDWRIRDPVTKRFLYKPVRVFFICSKKSFTEYKRKGRRWSEIELELACVIHESELDYITFNYPFNGLAFFSLLEDSCILCTLSECFVKYEPSIVYASLATWDEVGFSYTERPESGYVMFTDQWSAREYPVPVESCTECVDIMWRGRVTA